MKREIVSGLLCLGMATAMAADRTFPHEGGSNDMASPEAWGTDGLPSSTDKVIFSSGAVETVTASTQVAFGYLQNGHRNGYNEKLIFDMTANNPTLKFAGFAAGDLGRGYVHTYFKGGTWDFGGGPFGWGNTYYGDNRSIYISDGAVIKNTYNMFLGYTAQQNLHAELTGRSQLSVGGQFLFTNNKTAAGDENWLKILDGSTMTVAGNFAWEASASVQNAALNQPYGAMFYKDLVLVSGAGSKLTLNGSYNYLGQQGGSVTRIEDGAELKVTGGLVPWGGSCRNNLLRIDNATATCVHIYGGWSCPAGDFCDRSNRVEVVNGGVLTADTFYLGYNSTDAGGCPGNTLLVSNGTFQVKQFNLGSYSNSSNQYVLVQGEDAAFTVTDTWTLFTGAYSEFCVDLGATLTPPDNFGLYVGGRHHDTLRVRNGGKLTLRTGGLGTSADQSIGADTVCCWNNRIVADAGGIIEGTCIRVQGEACALEVTDATVTLAGGTQDYSIGVGYSRGYGGLGTNCVFTIAGARPRVTLAKKLTVQNGSRLVFKLPANGYDAGVVPLVCQSDIDVKSGCTLEITDAEVLNANLCEQSLQRKYILAENPSTAKFFTAAQVEAAAQTLPADAKLKLVSNGGKNQLELTIGVPPGIMLFVQ